MPDCGHGWRNDNDCDVCRPPAVVVAGLRGRISDLEVIVRSAQRAVDAHQAGYNLSEPFDAESALQAMDELAAALENLG